jgi:DNA-binding CsgD family transcriptional regulator
MDAVTARSCVCPVTVGRQHELAVVLDRLQAATPAVILVSGEAGIGKSRLVSDATVEAARLGYRVVRGRCFESDAGLPFAPLRDLLRSLLETDSTATLAALAGPYAAALARLLPEFAGAPAADAEPESGKRHLFEALDRILAGLASETPLVVIIEDLHWSDAASLEFLLFLARRLGGRSLALLATWRGDETGPDLAHFLAEVDRERLALEIPLTGLAAAGIDSMLRAIFGLAHPAPADLIHLLSTLTEGNPFFIEEVLKAMGATALASGPDGHWTLPEAETLRIPRSVQDAVTRRTARLSSPARRVLELAAVTGTRFEVDLVRDLAGLDEPAVLDALKELVAAQLVVEESAERFAFRHALTRQAVYASLLTRERRRLHREVAEALERSPLAASDATLPDLAGHAYAAEMWEKALDYSRRAGDLAMDLYAAGAAMAHYTRALEAARHLSRPPDPDLARARGSAHELLGEFDRARADYETASDLARNSGQRASEVEALLSLGLLWSARDYARAGLAVRNALAVARDTGDDALVARCLNRLGNWHLNCERPAEALRCHREALAIVERLGDRRGVAETLDLLGGSAFMHGDLGQGRSHLTRAIAIRREIGDRHGLASSLILHVMSAPTYHTDSVPAAASHAAVEADVEEGLAISRAIGWRAGEAWALWMQGGMNLAPHGAYARAFPSMQAALAIAEEIGHRQWLAATHCMLGNACADLLDFNQATRHLELALTHAQATALPYWSRSASAWLASVAIARGDLDTADARLTDLVTPGAPMESLAARLARCVAAELALARHKPDRALEIADRLVATAPGSSTGRPIARLELLRGEALTALGEYEAAAIALRRARDTAAELGTRSVLWRAHLALARLYRAQGCDDEATSAFAAARALIDELASDVPDDALRATFLAGTAPLLPTARQTSEPGPGGLTPRELEIARLLTKGLSNREIAAELFITEWTAATHVRNILAKLGLSSRTQIAAWAVANGLIDTDQT